VQFAERYPTEAELANAVGKFGSWHAIVNKVLAKGNYARNAAGAHEGT
jgi:hypothetical protein